MSDEKNPIDVKSAEPVTPATPEPAKPVQPTPEVNPVPGAPSTPDVKPEPGTVPLAALHEERTKRQQLEAEIAQLRQQPMQYNAAPPPVQDQVDPRKELETLWENDPRKAVQVEIMYAMDWRDRIDTGLEQQADQLAKKYPDFNNFRSAAMGYVRNLPLNQRGANGIIEAAYLMTRGQNMDTILQQRETELIEKYRRGEIDASQLATPAGSFSAPAPQGGTVLSEEQKNVAAMMGLTEEGYAQSMQNKPQSGA